MILASRTLHIAEHGSLREVAVHLHAPEANGTDWICRYEIDWPNAPREGFAAGIDAVQALHLTLQRIGTELYLSPHHASGALRWVGPGEGYGFPVPKNARDLLIGLDRDFDG